VKINMENKVVNEDRMTLKLLDYLSIRKSMSCVTHEKKIILTVSDPKQSIADRNSMSCAGF
jgi:hypothetical protein